MFFLNRISFLIFSAILCFVVLIVITLSEVLQKSNSGYGVAVIEYHANAHPPETHGDAILMENVQRYGQIINEIKDKVQLIVFPEWTLTTGILLEKRSDILNYSTPVPNPSEAVDACELQNHFPLFFTRLACAAKDAKVYVVVNLIEQKLCHKTSYYGEYRQCSNDSWDFYNTNVVFDRSGRVIARYRKYNLFGEVWFNRTVNPDTSVFKTDFGIQFGLFTCFDILFRRPAMDLVKLRKINHIVYPTMWYSELPFLTALQSQMQWAYESDSVLLSAGGNNCLEGSGGSGIFQGHFGALDCGYPEQGETKAYIATLSGSEGSNIDNEDDIDAAARRMDKFYLMKENLTDYTMIPLDQHQKNINKILCHIQGKSRLCCHFHMETETKDISKDKIRYNYYLVAFSGVRSFKHVAEGGIEVCGIVACTTEEQESCGQRFPNYDDIEWPTTFTKISIQANFSYKNDKIQYPNSLLSNIKPLAANSFDWNYKICENKTIIERMLNLKKPQNRLMTFAIYGRDFSKDVNFFH